MWAASGPEGEGIVPEGEAIVSEGENKVPEGGARRASGVQEDL